MGTSQSSNGPGSKLPIVPPWVPDPENVDDRDEKETNDNQQELSNQNLSTIEPLAPRGRFGSSRRSLNTYAKTGEKADMHRGIGQYIRSGYGGAKTATRRFGGTVSTAGTLYNALSQLDSNRSKTPDDIIDYNSLVGCSAKEIIDTIVEVVQPIDGTLDSEARKRSINDSLSELLINNQDTDLLNLKEEDIEFVMERFISNEVFKRFQLDQGRTIQDNASSPTTAVSRLKEIREYIRETISASFRRLKNSGRTLNTRSVQNLVYATLNESFEVFEEYA